MRSVGNIGKITKAMKMVAASKMRSAQVATESSRDFVAPLTRILGDLPDTPGAKALFVPVTTDRGLCGGINTTVAKYTRAAIKAANEPEPKIAVLGDKGRSQLQRDSRDLIAATIADTNKVRITFAQAGAVADELAKAYEFDVARIVFNRFVSAISSKPTITTALSPDALAAEAENGGAIGAYEIEGPDAPALLQNLAEFNLAAQLYSGLLESNCSEQSSRMSAMENSTKNANEMLAKLTLTYNRTRQASITTELIEIISGATALEG